MIEIESLPDQYKEERTDIWNENGSQDDPYAYYLEDTLTQTNNDYQDAVSKTHNDVTHGIVAVEFDLTTMSSEVDTSNASNIRMTTEKHIDNKEIIEVLGSHLQNVSSNNILALIKDEENGTLTGSKESSFDLGESILLNKLFGNTVILDNTESSESETTSSLDMRIKYRLYRSNHV